MSPAGLVFGAIADDLTGGVELASILVTEGIRTEFLVGCPDASLHEASTAAVVALKSRVSPREEAVASFREVADWYARAVPRQMFFKYCATFDSTNEGNIGPCADLLLGATGVSQLLFCPSYPDKGRTVYNGHLFMDDQLISNSPKRDDPLTPMTEPDLRKVLSVQSRHRVGLLPLSILSRGGTASSGHLDKLCGEGIRHVIADAVSDNDLRKIAELTVDSRLMSGNSTIAGFYPEIWRRRGLLDGREGPEPVSAVAGPGLVVAGSCAESTLSQLAHFEAGQGPVHRIDLLEALSGKDVVTDAIDWASQRTCSGDIAISTAATPSTVAEVQDRIGRIEAAVLAESILSRITTALVERGVRRIVVAGGETSGAIVAALGIQRIVVGPHRPGNISIGHARTQSGTTIGLSLKSGKLGPVDIFHDRLQAMQDGAV